MIAKLSWPILAAVITAALFLLMGYLITPQGSVPEVEEASPSVSITRTQREESSNINKRDKPKKPKPVTTPPPPRVVKTKPVVSKSKVALTGVLPSVLDGSGTKFSSMDRRATPVVRIPPQYPQGPLSRDIEGWVLVEFTITKTGTVDNIVVVDADPPKVFNRAALRAIKRWKYQPQMLDGKAVAQHEMREIFKFEIGESQN